MKPPPYVDYFTVIFIIHSFFEEIKFLNWKLYDWPDKPVRSPSKQLRMHVGHSGKIKSQNLNSLPATMSGQPNR
jgi:hypothetical protein